VVEEWLSDPWSYDITPWSGRARQTGLGLEPRLRVVQKTLIKMSYLAQTRETGAPSRSQTQEGSSPVSVWWSGFCLWGLSPKK